jgi:hypothetical protein
MAVRLTASSSERLYRATAPDYNAAFTWLIAFRPATQIHASIIGIRQGVSNIDECFVNSSNAYRLYWRETNANVTRDIVGPVISADTDYYIAMVRTSATAFQLYTGTTIDGMTSAGTNSGGNVAARSASTDIEIGAFNGGSSQFFDGQVRFSRLFTAALTLAEIKAAMTVAGTGLWGEWGLEDDTDIADTSGNGRDLTAANTPSTEADSFTDWGGLTATSATYPTAATNNSTGDENDDAWVAPTNVGADDGTEATITASTFDSPDISQQLVMSGFGFSVPGTATINGLMLEIDRRNSAGAASDNRVQLRDDGGTLVGNNNADTATDWPASLSIVTYGSATTLWGVALTPTMVNDSDFGVVLSAQADAANTDIQVDFVRMTIYYTPAAGGAPAAQTYYYRVTSQGAHFQ